MALALRAFLILRTSADSYVVHVCRDLEAIHQAWDARPNPASDSALLHIGFDRPSSSSFEDIGRNHPGRMLFSRSTKFAMPPAYQSTEHEVGQIEEIPVYLATTSWGYVVSEEEYAPYCATDSAGAGAAETHPSGWVAKYLAVDRDAAEALARAGVCDDESYLENEWKLNTDLRTNTARFRLSELMRDEIFDPCAIARLSPPWILDRPIASLVLSNRAKNCLKGSKIDTVEQLGGRSYDSLLRIRNFGERSMRDLCEALREAMAAGPVDQTEVESITLGNSRETDANYGFVTEIEQFIASLSEKEQQVFVRRAGFRWPSETLRQIAEDLGITRERVRQIESKILKRLERDGALMDHLVAKIDAALAQRHFPLPLRGIEAIDPWFQGLGEESDVVSYLLDYFDPEGICVVRVDHVDYLSRLSQLEWNEALRKAQEVIELGAREDWPEDQCKAIVSSLIDEDAKEFLGLLWTKATELSHFVEQGDGSRLLISHGRGAESVVEAVLAASESPLHFTEIAKRASERLSRPVDVRRAHSAAANIGILLARGRYGLAKHVPLSSENLAAIGKAAEAVVSTGTDQRQWHVSEILTALADEGAVALDGVDNYVLDHALRVSNRLHSLGRMLWTADGDAGENEADRITMREAIISTLESAGHPLSTEEIRQVVVVARGVSSFFQVFPEDPIIRVGPGKWGINDRDTIIKRAEQRGLMDRTVAVLEGRGAGLHVSEIDSSLCAEGYEGPLAYLVLSLAVDDPRLKIGHGQYLYIAQWGNPRRVTLLDALKQSLANSNQPLTLSELRHLVELATHRPCSNREVSARLTAIGAEYDPIHGTWQLESGGSRSENYDNGS